MSQKEWRNTEYKELLRTLKNSGSINIPFPLGARWTGEGFEWDEEEDGHAWGADGVTIKLVEDKEKSVIGEPCVAIYPYSYREMGETCVRCFPIVHPAEATFYRGLIISDDPKSEELQLYILKEALRTLNEQELWTLRYFLDLD
jgi:hypothetical protein